MKQNSKLMFINKEQPYAYLSNTGDWMETIIII